MVKVKGIDVSHWNYVNWDYWWALGYRFAFIKVSEGDDFEDDAWRIHREDAKETGFYVGPYHWFTPTINGIVQARWMYDVAGGAQWDIGPSLDVEEGSSLSTLVYGTRVRSCLNEMQIKWNRKPLVYTSYSKWKFTGNIVVPADLWVAHWTSRPEPLIPIGFSGYRFWQTGVDILDQDVFNGTLADLKAYLNIDPIQKHVIEETYPSEAKEIVIKLRRT